MFGLRIIFHFLVLAVAVDWRARHQFYHAFRWRRIVYGIAMDIFGVGDALAVALASDDVFAVCSRVSTRLHQ